MGVHNEGTLVMTVFRRGIKVNLDAHTGIGSSVDMKMVKLPII